MEAIRLRLKFSDGDILSDAQKLDGLRRSWIFVEPRHRTISDVVSHLLDGFHLSESCPNGVLLSMDGFVLPPFEPTAILKDKDTVCVKRKGAGLLDVARESGEWTAIPENLQLDLGLQLLAGEELEKETGGYLNETEEEGKLQNDSLHHLPNGGASTRKRKALIQLINSKVKKHHQNDSPSADQEHGGGCLQKCEDLLKSKHDQVCIPKAANNHGAVKCTAIAVCNNPNENREGAGTSSGLADVPKKGGRAGRSAARKRYLRSLPAAERQQHREKNRNPDDGNKPEEPDEDTETGDELVAVVVRPGHIRFTAPGKEKSVLQQEEEKGSFDWRGSVYKKKNRNRGKKKKQFSKRNEQKAPEKNQSPPKWSDRRSNQEKESSRPWDDFTSAQGKKSKWGEYRSPQNRPPRYGQNEYGNRRIGWGSQRAQPAKASIDYEKLIPLTDFPVEGDIIAYRVLGMDSFSSCPELTSYRVGKVSRFDSESNRIMLVPVPEYPFKFKTAADNLFEEVPDAYRYKEDGSLEIDYPSLADVRTVKHSNMNPNTTFHNEASGAPSSSGWKPSSSGWNPTSSGWKPSSSGAGLGTRSPARNNYPSSQAPASGSGWVSPTGLRRGAGCGDGASASDKEPPAQPASSNWTASRSSPAPETGSEDAWEKLSSALSAEKAEALREDNWQKKRACASRLVSAGAPRGGRALGRFRGRNGR